MLPDVVLDEILQNSWHQILMLHNCRSLSSVFPSAIDANDSFLGDIIVEEPEISATDVDNTLHNLQRWAPVLFQAYDDDTDVDVSHLQRERETLKTMALWARSCSCLLNGNLPLSARLCAEQNIDIQMLLSHIKSTDLVQTVVDISVAALFPGNVFKAARGKFGADGHKQCQCYGSIPTRKRLEGNMLALEVADLVVARNESLKVSRMVFGHMDSSPVGPENWFMHRCISIAVTDVLVVVAAHNSLLELPDADSDSDGLHKVSYVDRTSQNTCIFQTLMIRLHVPVSLGLGAAAIQDKVASTLHQLAVESRDASHLLSKLTEYRSVTLDMVVEVKIADCHVPSHAVERLLPPWMLSTSEAREEDLDNDAEGFPGTATLVNSFGNAFLPNAFTIGGVHYLLPTVAKDTAASLQDFPGFYDMLKVEEQLLGNAGRREK